MNRRPAFFIYDPDYSVEDLRELADTIHNNTSFLLFIQSTNISLAEDTHMDGLFAYEAVQNVLYFYDAIVKAAKEKHLIVVPCVSPGFNINRTFYVQSPLVRGRNDGKTYDDWWKRTLSSKPDHVAIISFNEWHEGTQIEPAARINSSRYRYRSYDGAYGKTGIIAEQSFLRRTARWIDLFEQLISQ